MIAPLLPIALVASSGLAALPFDSRVPVAKRHEELRSHFDPPIGEVLRLSSKERSRRSKNPEKVELMVRVTPPKGVCFTITRRLDVADDRVCKEAYLSAALSDIDEDGRIQWTVRTGPDDFGTPVYWETPYRVGRYVTRKMEWPGPSKALFVVGCDVKKKSAFGRSIEVSFLNGKSWNISFPEVDRMIRQPPEPENLMVYTPTELARLIDSRAEEDAADNPDPKPEEKEGQKGSDPISKETEKRREQILSENPWQIRQRGTYEMNGSNLRTHGSNSPNMRGVCRYNYKVSKIVAGGVVECQVTPYYNWVYLPLACMEEIAPKAAK